MKKWRFFPMLVKEEILKNMDLWEKLSYAECSKKCRNLLCRIPNHLESFIMPDDNDFSVDDFLTLMTCQKSTIQELMVEIEIAHQRDRVNKFLLKLNKVRNSLKVKKLIMKIRPIYPEMHKKCMDFCDPSFIESIEIKRLNSQEIYEDVLRTPQWRNSQKISLNFTFDGLLEVNIDDFLRFKSIKLKMEELSVNDAWKLVQNFLSIGSQGDYIHLKCEKRKIQADLIREKIETELAGDWKDVGMRGHRYLQLSENPNKVLVYIVDRDVFFVAVRDMDYINMRLALIQ